MFNIHSTEILLILIVALVVIGPERLPMAVKTVGLWVGRFRRSFYKVKAEIERELNTDEIRRQLHNESVLAQIDEAKAKVESVAKETETSVNKIVNTDNFDPGASNATDDKNSDQDEKSIQEELQDVSDQVEEVAKEIYQPNSNPKVVNSEPTDKKAVKQKDGIS